MAAALLPVDTPGKEAAANEENNREKNLASRGM
jgi:hypothetical protein